MQRKNNRNLTSLLNLLSDGKPHDGNVLGEHLGLTRAAVWKMIQKLQGLGVLVQSIKGQGYILKEPLVLLDAERIQAGLTQPVALSVFESIASTNDYLLNEPRTKTPSVCVAEMQTAGRGRLGRAWVSPFGKNIYCSLRFHFKKDISELSGLSLMVSLSILKTLKQLKLPLFVKWPNDVVCDQGKLSGTLIELKAESNGGCEAVIGIGINVNMLPKGVKGITQPWVSLRQLSGDYHDRNEILSELINTLIDDLNQFEAKGFSVFQKAWIKHHYHAHQPVTLSFAETKVQGEAIGVNELGHLLLKLSNGKTQAFASGDVSLR
jgi:BirA family biotin operon repressor/biotin-[acetyl-CoA-carboxylase] ligase